MNDTLPRVGRRAAARKARRRRQLVLIGAALGVLALLAVAFAVYLAVDAPEPPTSPPEAARTPQTLSLPVLKLPPGSVQTLNFGSVADVAVLVGDDSRP